MGLVRSVDSEPLSWQTTVFVGVSKVQGGEFNLHRPGHSFFSIIIDLRILFLGLLVKRAELWVELVVKQFHCGVQMARSQVGIPMWAGDVLMPEQFLDFEQAAAFCSELAGEAVAQVVPLHGLGNGHVASERIGIALALRY